MKILHITNIYPPHHSGGAEIYVKNLAEYQQRCGNTVHVLTACPGRDFQDENVINLDRKSSDLLNSLLLPSPRTYIQVRKHIKRLSPRHYPYS